MLKRILARPGSALAIVTGAALAGLFALPRVRVVSLGAEVGTATGIQLAKGEVSIRRVALSGEAVEPKPWFWLGAAIPAFLLLAGAVGAARAVRRRSAGAALVLLALVGVGATLTALGVKYGNPALFDTRPTTVFWFCLGLYGLTVLAGLLEIAVSFAAGERSSPSRRTKRRKTS